jgi:hypothetical protein
MYDALAAPNLGVTGTAGLCLSMQENVWGALHWYDYALQAWNASSPFNHPDEQPPVNVSVLLFWSYYDQKDDAWYGHVATWVPGRGVFSSPFNSTTGSEWYPSIAAMTARINRIPRAQAVYLGWSEQIANVRVAQPQGATMAIIDSGDNWIARADKTMYMIRGRHLGNGELTPFVGKDFLTFAEAVEDDPEADTATHWQEVGQIAVTNDWKGQIDALNTQLAAAQANTAQLTKTIASVTTDDDAQKASLSAALDHVAMLSTDLATAQASITKLTTAQAVIAKSSLVRPASGLTVLIARIRKALHL